jgi:putative transcriptional regulator
MKNLVKEQREAKRLTQDELAQALGVSRQTINSIETGRYVASLQLALMMAAFFKTSVETLFILETKEIKK